MSGDYLADLRIRVEPGPGVVASLRGTLLVVPSVRDGQEQALHALLSVASGGGAVRGVARVVADHDPGEVPPFCMVTGAGPGSPFAVVHGPVELTVRGAGAADEVVLRGADSRLWVDRPLPDVVERIAVHAVEDVRTGARLVLEASTGDLSVEGRHEASDVEDVLGSPAPSSADPEPEPAAPEPAAADLQPEPAAADLQPEPAAPALRMPETVPDATTLISQVSASARVADDAPEDSGDADPAPSPYAADLASRTAAGDAAVTGDDPDADESDPVPDDGSLDRGRAVIGAAAPGGTSAVSFKPEPVRFGQGGRLEPAESAAAVNGWHEPTLAAAPAPSAPPAEALTLPPEPPAPRPEAPAPPPEAPGLPLRPQAGIPPQAPTQLVAPPPGLFPGAVPPPVQPGFDPFGAVAPRPPEGAGLLHESASPPIPAPSPASGIGYAARGSSRAPGLGRLMMENGPDVVVDGDCVIGRNPEVDPDVAQGRAKPVVLPDVEQRISRVHARLLVGEAGVEIIDAGSVNGTWIEPPGGAGWIAMVPRVPAPLPLGSRIQVGDLVLSYVPLAAKA